MPVHGHACSCCYLLLRDASHGMQPWAHACVPKIAPAAAAPAAAPLIKQTKGWYLNRHQITQDLVCDCEQESTYDIAVRALRVRWRLARAFVPRSCIYLVSRYVIDGIRRISGPESSVKFQTCVTYYKFR